MKDGRDDGLKDGFDEGVQEGVFEGKADGFTELYAQQRESAKPQVFEAYGPTMTLEGQVVEQ